MDITTAVSAAIDKALLLDGRSIRQTVLCVNAIITNDYQLKDGYHSESPDDLFQKGSRRLHVLGISGQGIACFISPSTICSDKMTCDFIFEMKGLSLYAVPIDNFSLNKQNQHFSYSQIIIKVIDIFYK